ncbi:DUF308 domain-containing protein [Leucobacter weissii]|uniref:DUF308 domain-containing protein n=1 Tax=Leucobacter weissii TaxID=1983706 RepID=A0A939SA08_9MICO|nr:DUF308 domain-containing protein [Leucobacter weissii]MBO1901467.1 DUF308 domain-containing protein [Leucobacter weissii]
MSEQNLLTEPESKGLDIVRVFLGISGLISLVLGILILANPVKTGAGLVLIVTVLLAIYLVGVGVIYLGSGIFSKSLEGWPRIGTILLGLLYIVGGIIIFANVSASATVFAVFLSVLIGVLWIIEGVFVFTTLKTSGHRVLTVVYGVISIIAGLVLIFSPLLGAVTLWLLIGISLIVLGAVQVVRAFTVKAE